jgi:hypothetical protein
LLFSQTAQVNDVVFSPPDGKIMQVLGAHEAIAVRPAWEGGVSGGGGDTNWGEIQGALNSVPEIIFHVAGLEMPNLSDGQPLPSQLMVCDGTYTYVDVSHARRTVQSYIVGRSVTKTEFAAALAGGFVLYHYSYAPVSVEVARREKFRQMISVSPEAAQTKGKIKASTSAVQYYQLVKTKVE